MANRTYSVRLSVENEAAFRKALEDAGLKGSASLKRIGDAARPASTGLRALDGAAQAAGAGMDGLAARAGTLGGILRGLGAGGLFVAGAVGGFVALAAAAKNAMASIAAIGDAADRAQIDAGVYETLQAGLIQTGQATEGLEASLSKFSRTVGEAQAGSGDAASAFADLGVAVVNTDGSLRSTEDILRDVADRFAAIQSPAERAVVATKFFEEGGRALIPLLSQGADGMEALAAEAENLGLIFGGDVIRRSQELNAEFDRQWKIIDTQLKSAFVEFAPVVVVLAQAFAAFARIVGGGVVELAKLLGLVQRTKLERAEALQGDLVGEMERLGELEAQLKSAEERAATPPNLARMNRGRLIGEIPGVPSDPLGVAVPDQTATLRAQVEAQRAAVRRIAAEAQRLMEPPAPVTIDLPPVVAPAAVAPAAPGGGKTTPARESVDEFLRRSTQIQQQIEALRRVVEGTPAELGGLFLGNDDAALKGYEAQLKVLGEIFEARQKGVELTPAEVASIEERARITGQLVAEDERALAAIQDRRAEQARDAEDRQRQAEDLRGYLQDQTLGLAELVAGLDKGADAWKRYAAGIAEALAQAVLFQEGPLAGLFTGTPATPGTPAAPAGGGLGGILSGIGGFLGNLFGFARGGVPSVAAAVQPFARGGVPSVAAAVQPFARGGVPSVAAAVQPFARGGVPSVAAAVQPFARGGVPSLTEFVRGGAPDGIVSEPTLFPMAGGKIGLMGEAGREAILPLAGDAARPAVRDAATGAPVPLARDAMGRLGVDLGGLSQSRAPQPFAAGGAFSAGAALPVPPAASLAAAPAGRPGGGSVNVTFSPTVNAQAGADVGMIRAVLDQQRREFEARTPALVVQAIAEHRRARGSY